ncbi:hypothetical protein OIU34_28840 [Pararhizobium sp. BT-229]|uniref:hypothetical protein n=1 Tax=Pararhizobium sp. BT-229 TaxID=2986923 RepID=UPI0021F71603|nr:hypothetical protein [Pararhizobium sp. BT-229]MCV9965883.1 hypothetical protein [Pararhizobium sp. BT-229]
MGSFIALRLASVKRSAALKHHMLDYWIIRHCFVMIGLIWKRRTSGESRLSGTCTFMPVSSGIIGNAVLVQTTPDEAFPARESIRGEFEMPGKKTDKNSPRAAANLVEQYRPLGLKAVLAAALQIKPKPVKKPALPKQPA